MEQFILQIIRNLETNGFPGKKVSLPTEKMYEIADQKNLSLNSVLEEMRSNHQIDFEISTERIIFEKMAVNQFTNNDFDLSGISPDMMAKAQEMMKGMDPEKLSQIQDQVMSMSPEQRQSLLDKAKNMGIF